MKLIIYALLTGCLLTGLCLAEAAASNLSEEKISALSSEESLSPTLSKEVGENTTEVLEMDSVRAKIDIKISIYEKQLSLNKESITQLEMELEERKKLNERLNAAILVSREILNELLPTIKEVQQE